VLCGNIRYLFSLRDRFSLARRTHNPSKKNLKHVVHIPCFFPSFPFPLSFLEVSREDLMELREAERGS